MARITLKGTKSPASTGVPRAPTSRAKRAQLQSQRHKPQTPTATVAAPAPSSAAPGVAKVAGEPVRAAPGPEGDRTSSSPAAKLSRRGKPLPAEGSRRRTTAGSSGATRSADRGKPSGAAGPKRASDARNKPSKDASPPRAPTECRPRTDRGKPRSAYAAGAPATPRVVPTPNAEPSAEARESRRSAPIETDERAGPLLAARSRRMDRERLGEGRRQGRRHARRARVATRADRIDPGGGAAPERAGDDPAQQADGLRFRPGRGWAISPPWC